MMAKTGVVNPLLNQATIGKCQVLKTSLNFHLVHCFSAEHKPVCVCVYNNFSLIIQAHYLLNVNSVILILNV